MKKSHSHQTTRNTQFFFFEKKLNDLTRKTQGKTNAYLPSLGRPTSNCKNKFKNSQSGQITLLTCQQALHFEKRARRAATVMRERAGKTPLRPGRVANLSRHHPNEELVRSSLPDWQA